MDVLRGDRSLRSSLDTVELVAGDRIVVRSKMGDLLGLREAGDVALGSPELHAFEPLAAQEPVHLEGVVGPQALAVGRRLVALALPRRSGAYCPAVPPPCGPAR